MPELSFVVAAHDVEPYIERCLASLLAGAHDIEVVVVDDGSSDGTATVVEALRAGDERVRLVSNPVATGPGRARNAGLAEAAGTYVWFVDGDDWVLEGAVRSVMDRLAGDGDVDVVVVDHVRHYPSGRVAPGSSRDLLRRAPSQPFELSQWPDLVTVLHVPWNKVIRRALLDETGIRFSAAPVYEDVSFTYGVLRAAARISVLPVPCYVYRTARPGALTRTSGDRHLVWAEEWDVALRAAAGDPAVVRRALFAQMVRHGWAVFGVQNGLRVRGRLRRRFFGRFASLHDERRTDGVRADPVLALGWWPVGEVRAVASALWWAIGRLLARVRATAS